MTFRVRSVILWLFCAGIAVNLQAGSIVTSRPPQLRSAAVLVKDQHSGEFLMSKQVDVAMPIASITKLMTAMAILDARLNMSEIITIEEADKDTLRNSQSHLHVGTRLTRREALLVALMASENRAAHALGRTFPGGLPALVKAMNEKARALELDNTHFADPTGLSGKNVSSARDLGRLVTAAGKYPEICACTTTSKATIHSGKKQLQFVNTNALVGSSRWQINLSKTGYIEEGGRDLVMQARIARRPLLIVLLNSAGKNARIGDANRIRQWLEGSHSSSISGKNRVGSLTDKKNKSLAKARRPRKSGNVSRSSHLRVQPRDLLKKEGTA
jgi:serine-type D-Ala-D-Ala endopeptidase (penicillin-binding protein 7)